MKKLTQKIARSLGDRLGRLINYALYDTRYKKVYLEVRDCGEAQFKGSHPQHVWPGGKGYVRGYNPYVCEGVYHADAQKDVVESTMDASVSSS